MLLRPFSVPLDKSGERHLYATTSSNYPPMTNPDGSAVISGAGVRGSGAYLLSWDGSPCGKQDHARVPEARYRKADLEAYTKCDQSYLWAERLEI